MENRVVKCSTKNTCNPIHRRCETKSNERKKKKPQPKWKATYVHRKFTTRSILSNGLVDLLIIFQAFAYIREHFQLYIPIIYVLRFWRVPCAIRRSPVVNHHTHTHSSRDKPKKNLYRVPNENWTKKKCSQVYKREQYKCCERKKKKSSKKRERRVYWKVIWDKVHAKKEALIRILLLFGFYPDPFTSRLTLRTILVIAAKKNVPTK